MPVLRNRAVFDLARGVRAFFGFEAGLTRAEALVPENDEIQNLHRLAAEKAAEIERLEKEVAASVGRTDGVDPENIVWIFGVARVGSTWLASMMGETEGFTVWNEPRVGSLLGNFYYGRGAHRGGKHGILGGPDEKRSRAIRAFILASAHEKFPEVSGDGYLVVKEPNGSNGAPLLAQALPESRMIFLVRDPRDVASSGIGAASEGGWYAETRKRRGGASKEQSPDDIVEARSKRYVEFIGRSKEAYQAHRGPKVLVKYEELRADTLGTMKRMYSGLGISVEEDEVARAVEKHSWENIPEEKKGPDKFYRKATPGGWREDLTPEQVRVIERITAPFIEEFYSA
ncbi:MAG: sulfotransferase domain-containing protein [Rubrobacter sp.]|nr:sulfotransferase domain-containing protein [Rubrobacter sp.]